MTRPPSNSNKRPAEKDDMARTPSLNKRPAEKMYDYMQPKAEAVKVALQMLIGAMVIVLIFLKLLWSVYSPSTWLLPKLAEQLAAHLAKPNPLEITGYALAVSACVELAHMLYTPGPDEAIEPLILGFSAATLIVISGEDIITYKVAAVVFVLTAGIGFLFWVKNNFSKTA